MVIGRSPTVLWVCHQNWESVTATDSDRGNHSLPPMNVDLIRFGRLPSTPTVFHPQLITSSRGRTGGRSAREIFRCSSMIDGRRGYLIRGVLFIREREREREWIWYLYVARLMNENRWILFGFWRRWKKRKRDFGEKILIVLRDSSRDSGRDVRPLKGCRRFPYQLFYVSCTKSDVMLFCFMHFRMDVYTW